MKKISVLAALFLVAPLLVSGQTTHPDFDENGGVGVAHLPGYIAANDGYAMYYYDDAGTTRIAVQKWTGMEWDLVAADAIPATGPSASASGPALVQFHVEGDVITAIIGAAFSANAQILVQSTDGGETWTFLQEIAAISWANIGDIITFNGGQEIHLVRAQNSGIEYRKSTDGGATISAPDRLDDENGAAGSSLANPLSDANGGHFFYDAFTDTLKVGFIAMEPGEGFFVVETQDRGAFWSTPYQPGGNPDYKIVFSNCENVVYTSDYDGQNWILGARLSGTSCPSVTIQGAGLRSVAYVSMDAGETWQVTEVNLDVTSAQAVPYSQSVAVDGGRFYAAAQVNDGSFTGLYQRIGLEGEWSPFKTGVLADPGIVAFQEIDGLLQGLYGNANAGGRLDGFTFESADTLTLGGVTSLGRNVVDVAVGTQETHPLVYARTTGDNTPSGTLGHLKALTTSLSQSTSVDACNFADTENLFFNPNAIGEFAATLDNKVALKCGFGGALEEALTMADVSGSLDPIGATLAKTTEILLELEATQSNFIGYRQTSGIVGVFDSTADPNGPNETRLFETTISGVTDIATQRGLGERLWVTHPAGIDAYNREGDVVVSSALFPSQIIAAHGNDVYVGESDGKGVRKLSVSGASLQPVAYEPDVTVGAGGGLVISHDGAYLVAFSGTTVSLLDASTLELLGQLSFPLIRGADIDLSNNHVFVAQGKNVARLDIWSLTESNTGDGGTGPNPPADIDGVATPDNGPDSDNDGVSDDNEASAGTNPNDADSDNDGVSDGDETALGTDPENPDTDGDGFTDGQETNSGTDANDELDAPTDTDGDGLPDSYERVHGTDPNNADSDGDGTLDGAEDDDGDGLNATAEASHGTDPNNADSDGDTQNDGDEVNQGTLPNDAYSNTLILEFTNDTGTGGGGGGTTSGSEGTAPWVWYLIGGSLAAIGVAVGFFIVRRRAQ